MEWFEERERREAELDAAIGRFVVAWAAFEQALPSTNYFMVQTNDLYHRYYGTKRKDLPVQYPLNEEAKFIIELKAFKKISKTAMPGKIAEINNISKRAVKLYSARNDIVHRASFLADSWWGKKSYVVECKRKRELPGKDKYKILSYSADELSEMTKEARSLSMEVRGLVSTHVQEVMRENNLTPDILRQLQQRPPANDR